MLILTHSPAAQESTASEGNPEKSDEHNVEILPMTKE